MSVPLTSRSCRHAGRLPVEGRKTYSGNPAGKERKRALVSSAEKGQGIDSKASKPRKATDPTIILFTPPATASRRARTKAAGRFHPQPPGPPGSSSTSLPRGHSRCFFIPRVQPPRATPSVPPDTSSSPSLSRHARCGTHAHAVGGRL
jgi:hypothetical protein